MTNTRLTDPEVLERRFSVRLREFSIRRGSGRAGRNRGGDGVVRRMEFLKPLTVSIVSQRPGHIRLTGSTAPAPRAGTKLAPANRWHHGEDSAASAQFAVKPGQIPFIETPGGGGYGSVPV